MNVTVSLGRIKLGDYEALERAIAKPSEAAIEREPSERPPKSTLFTVSANGRDGKANVVFVRRFRRLSQIERQKNNLRKSA